MSSSYKSTGMQTLHVYCTQGTWFERNCGQFLKHSNKHFIFPPNPAETLFSPAHYTYSTALNCLHILDWLVYVQMFYFLTDLAWLLTSILTWPLFVMELGLERKSLWTNLIWENGRTSNTWLWSISKQILQLIWGIDSFHFILNQIGISGWLWCSLRKGWRKTGKLHSVITFSLTPLESLIPKMTMCLNLRGFWQFSTTKHLHTKLDFLQIQIRECWLM